MIRRMFIAALATAPLAAGADDPALSGAEIAALMPTIFIDHRGTWQDFDPDGSTWIVFRNSSRTPGRWWIAGDLYCERIPPEDTDRCFHVFRGRPDGTGPDRFLTLVDPAGERHTMMIGTR